MSFIYIHTSSRGFSIKPNYQVISNVFGYCYRPTPGYLWGNDLLFWFCASADTRHSRLGWDCATIQIGRESTQVKVDSGRRTGTSGWLFINLNSESFLTILNRLCILGVECVHSSCKSIKLLEVPQKGLKPGSPMSNKWFRGEGQVSRLLPQSHTKRRFQEDHLTILHQSIGLGKHWANIHTEVV